MTPFFHRGYIAFTQLSLTFDKRDIFNATREQETKPEIIKLG